MLPDPVLCLAMPPALPVASARSNSSECGSLNRTLEPDSSKAGLVEMAMEALEPRTERMRPRFGESRNGLPRTKREKRMRLRRLFAGSGNEIMTSRLEVPDG